MAPRHRDDDGVAHAAGEHAARLTSERHSCMIRASRQCKPPEYADRQVSHRQSPTMEDKMSRVPRRPLAAIGALLLCLTSTHVTWAKSIRDYHGWFGPGGKAAQFSSTIHGKPHALEDAADYLMSDAGYERQLKQALRKLSPRPSVTGHWCELDEDKGEFRYHGRNIFRPLSMAADWRVWEGADRNTRWRHHGFGLAGCYVKILEEDRPRGARLLRSLIKDWYRANAVVAPPDPEFSWGDHSTPIRLRQTIAIYLLLRKHGLADREFTLDVLRLVNSHTRILLEDPDIRMRRSNHAVDQAYAIFLSGAVFPFIDYSLDPLSEAQTRAVFEANHLVARDGVQTENSPEYHRWVPTRTFALLEGLARFQETPVPPGMKRRMTGATWFAAWITRPDGTLPQIGDTGRVPQTFRAPKSVPKAAREALAYVKSNGREGRAPEGDTRIFATSGYLIHRDRWSPGLESDDLHMVFKCGFLSSGHRHDDDGNLVLYSHGEDWLIDAGLFGYEKTRPEREYVRSPLAHNVSVPLGMGTTRSTGTPRFKQNRKQWGLFPDRLGMRARCRSFMYVDAEYIRDFELVPGTGVTLQDKFDGLSGDAQVMTIFRFPPDKRIEIGSREASIRICSTAAEELCMSIGYEHSAIADVEVSRGEDRHGFSFRTTDYLKTEDVQTVRLIWRKAGESPSFRIAFPVRDPVVESPPTSTPAVPGYVGWIATLLAIIGAIAIVVGSYRRRRQSSAA
ncbi:heparinase II/III family protein [Luteimonas sp. M1R5S18]|uniref:Heparinase II/III family protein n=1 Tax=Luteimonas rhizosphaericola TaxID=3042024 RepID=A0ABT6JL63_9GAMM|nr:heparinase II/III family protein [Luteimonas rhizosphaericola]MDH5831178.1 heparinase II/III family protein [Luteimonas rhizosphaericola]